MVESLLDLQIYIYMESGDYKHFLFIHFLKILILKDVYLKMYILAVMLPEKG